MSEPIRVIVELVDNSGNVLMTQGPNWMSEGDVLTFGPTTFKGTLSSDDSVIGLPFSLDGFARFRWVPEKEAGDE
jgi:hypothetical protein